MERSSVTPWILMAAAFGLSAGTVLFLVPRPWLAVPLVLAVVSFITAVVMTREQHEPARWPARTVSGRRFALRADADRVLEVAGQALETAGVQRLERWPSELIASRDSLGGSEHVEVRLCTMEGVVYVDVRGRSDDPVARPDDVVDHVVAALQAM